MNHSRLQLISVHGGIRSSVRSQDSSCDLGMRSLLQAPLLLHEADTAHWSAVSRVPSRDAECEFANGCTRRAPSLSAVADFRDGRSRAVESGSIGVDSFGVMQRYDAVSAVGLAAGSAADPRGCPVHEWVPPAGSGSDCPVRYAPHAHLLDARQRLIAYAWQRSTGFRCVRLITYSGRPVTSRSRAVGGRIVRDGYRILRSGAGLVQDLALMLHGPDDAARP